MTDLTKKLEQVEMNNCKRMVIISGLELPKTKKEENVERLQAFIEENLGIRVVVDDLYFIGNSSPKAIVCEFQSCRDKRLVIKFKYLLKNYRDNGRKVFINDYVPISTQEKRRREYKIIADIEGELGVDPNNSEEVETGIQYTKNGLTIHGSPYRKRVIPPTPKQMLDLDPKQLETILNIKTKKGQEIKMDKSVFIPYAANVRSHQEVRDIYTKLKLVQPEARHIACAYWIHGPTHTSRDFHDDGEPGSGRVLLDVLEKNELKETAVFVVRLYGGV